MTDVGSVFTTVIGWVGSVGTAITSNPILMLSCVALPLAGLAIGMFKRLLTTRA